MHEKKNMLKCIGVIKFTKGKVLHARLHCKVGLTRGDLVSASLALVLADVQLGFQLGILASSKILCVYFLLNDEKEAFV